MKIFSGLKIVDLSRVFSGPFATRHFSDMGARVIKVESPSGDDSRTFPPILNGASGYYELLNRGKEIINLDLKDTSDLDKLYKIVSDSDVFVENFSPSIKNKLKIDYATIKKHNKNIIYASINGISDNVDKRYYDVIAQAESGLASLNGDNNDMKIATSVVDAFAGMKLAHAISSALYYRAINKTGLKITVSMKGSAFDLLEQNLIQASIYHINPSKVGNLDNAIAPFGLYKTGDGAIAIACGNDTLWNKLRVFLQISEEDNDKYFRTNKDRVDNIILLTNNMEKVFSDYTTDTLNNKLDDLGIPNGKVMKMLDVIGDQENFQERLLRVRHHPLLGDIVEPLGGITYE